jgi:drug/metabolite transporter (DMT)-like permease
MREFKGTLMIIGAAVLWGLSATFAKVLQNLGLTTIVIVQSRVLWSAVILLMVFGTMRRSVLRVPARELWRFALLGVIGFAGANFTYYAVIKESTVATGILLQYTAPVFVMLYAVRSGMERFSPIKLVAALVSLAGCFLAVGQYDPGAVTLGPSVLLMGAASVFCFAFLTVYSRRLIAQYRTWTVTVYAVVFASLFWFLINPPWQMVHQVMAPELWIALVILAVISVLLPHALFIAGLRTIDASRGIIISTLEPVVAIVSASVILSEHLSAVQVLGAAMVVLAVVGLNASPEGTGLIAPRRPPVEDARAL